MLAFVMDTDAVPQIWVKPIGNGAPVQVTHDRAPSGRPRWSPRGDQLVFEREGGIWSVPPLGGATRLLIQDARSPGFSADGSQIVFERGTSGTQWGIWVADAEGRHPRRVEGTPQKLLWTEPSYPAMSPDGQWIAFFRHTDGPRGDYWIVRSAGGGARQLTSDEREGGGPAWTIDGRSLIVSSDRHGSRTLWRVPIYGGPAQALTTGAGSDDEPQVAPDGRSVLYTSYRDRHALVAWSPAGLHQRLIEGPHPMYMPDVSPRGDRVTFFKSLDGVMQVFTMALDGTDLRQVTFGGAESRHPSWSADGRSIFFYQQKPTTAWRRINIDTRDEAEQISGWNWPTHSNPQIDVSGRLVLYTRVGFDTGDFSRDTTYVRDLSNNEERALEAPHLHMAFWSPDGQHMAGWRHDGTIVVCRKATATCQKLTDGLRPVWSHDGGTIYFQRKPATHSAEVWRIDLASRQETRLGRIEPFHPLSPNVDVTPDGRIIFAEYLAGRRELWRVDLW
jgi:Tol biopolymer transport system component